MLQKNRKSYLDFVYGVRKNAKGVLMIGNSNIQFGPNPVKIEGKTYIGTPGLLDSLFRKTPDETLISRRDIDTYKEILISSNAYKKNIIQTNQ